MAEVDLIELEGGIYERRNDHASTLPVQNHLITLKKPEYARVQHYDTLDS